MFFAVFLEYRFAEDEEGFEVLEDLELLDFVILEVWGGFEEVFWDFDTVKVRSWLKQEIQIL